MANKKIIMIRGDIYDSYSEAAEALDVSTALVSYYVRLGREDEIGLLPPIHDGMDKKISVRGTIYKSMSDAARALGVTISAVSHARGRGTLDNLGVRIENNLFT